ncbi:MAG: hypothetical protein KJO55_06785 [Gammaproteobacteria bacterium]|nr:hypothetical protein [Gammaproteobacteria bacterium]NND60951.1 hypothetical protein [Gammaproteobacteria bacterium]
MTQINPVIGDWYKMSGGSIFEVVAFDEDDGTIEVQHYDGTVEEYELDAWHQMLLASVEPPEDWAGSMDIDKEDYGVDLENNRVDWHENPLDKVLDS